LRHDFVGFRVAWKRERPGERGARQGGNPSVLTRPRHAEMSVAAARGFSLFLAVPDATPHPALLPAHLAATFSSTATGHAFSSTGVDDATDRRISQTDTRS